jgi:hypothetical protein
MPCLQVTILSQRKEFVTLATHAGANRRALCRRSDLSPPPAPKGRERYRQEGDAGFYARSRTPPGSPQCLPLPMQEAIPTQQDGPSPFFCLPSHISLNQYRRACPEHRAPPPQPFAKALPTNAGRGTARATGLPWRAAATP